MSTDKKTDDTSSSVNLELNGKILHRREQQVGAQDPYDSRRTFAAVKAPLEVFRRRREDDEADQPREQQKRVKFEIADETSPEGPKSGYDPYDAS